MCKNETFALILTVFSSVSLIQRLRWEFDYGKRQIPDYLFYILLDKSRCTIDELMQDKITNLPIDFVEMLLPYGRSSKIKRFFKQ